ncbi:hypothetical protein FRC15_012055 [Serendipita sp. 397]|nr:hypothetical protein FRC15_012055 [Serendipita sp. 397]
MGYRSLDDLMFYQRVPEPDTFVPSIQRVEKAIAMRKATLRRTMPPRVPAEPVNAGNVSMNPGSSLHASLPPKPSLVADAPSPNPSATAAPTSAGVDENELEKRCKKDEKIQELERQSQAYSWLAIRSASRNHLHLFNKANITNIEALVASIKEDEKMKSAAKLDEEGDNLSEKGEASKDDVDMDAQNTVQAENENVQENAPENHLVDPVPHVDAMPVDSSQKTEDDQAAIANVTEMEVDSNSPTKPTQ